MGDYQPLSETYTDHWKDATFENVKQEVARLVLMLFSDDIMVPRSPSQFLPFLHCLSLCGLTILVGLGSFLPQR